MQALAVGAELRCGRSRHDRVAEGGQGSGVAPGAGADIEDAARRRGHEMQDLAMNVGEAHALVLLHQRIGGLAVAFGAGARTSRSAHESEADSVGVTPRPEEVRAPSRRACLAASKAARRSTNLPAAAPAAAAIEGAGSVS